MSQPWIVVLAGGEGLRLRPLIRSWFSVDRAKQFCALVGSRTMLQHTLDRAAAISDPDRIVTVIGPGQRPHLEAALRPGWKGPVLEQPMARGTAAAVLFGLAHVLARDPEATVIVMPSDHFVHPEETFISYLRFARQLAVRHADRLVLLGALPSSVETDYGWVLPSHDGRVSLNGQRVVEGQPARVLSFHERPNPGNAQRLLRSGGLWNTHVFAVQGTTLWGLVTRRAPSIMEPFKAIHQSLRESRAGVLTHADPQAWLNDQYGTIAAMDFAPTVLGRICDHMLTLPLAGVVWSDWGRPERVLEMMHRFNLTPAPTMTAANGGVGASYLRGTG